MIPGAVDLDFVRGDDFFRKFVFVDDTTSAPLNLTGMTFAAKVRLFEDDTPFVAFTVDQTNLATGILIISLAKAVTATMARVYVWDLQRTDGSGVVWTQLAGGLTVKEDVTR